MSAHSRRKGASAEREVARILRDHLGLEVERNLNQSRAGGDDLAKAGPFSFEVKRRASGYSSAWWEQCVTQAGDKIPALIYRFDRQPWLLEIQAERLMPSLEDATVRITMPLVPGGVAVLRELMATARPVPVAHFPRSRSAEHERLRLPRTRRLPLFRYGGGQGKTRRGWTP